MQRTQAQGQAKGVKDTGVPKAQRSEPKRLNAWLKDSPSQEQVQRNAHAHSGLTMPAMAKELGITLARVSQLIAKGENAGLGT